MCKNYLQSHANEQETFLFNISLPNFLRRNAAKGTLSCCPSASGPSKLYSYQKLSVPEIVFFSSNFRGKHYAISTMVIRGEGLPAWKKNRE